MHHILKISSGWILGGGGHSPQADLLRSGLHRFPQPKQEEENFGCVNTHPPLHKEAQL